MPVRSLNSSVIRWPNREQIEAALQKWSERSINQNDTVLAMGYFGSYARNEAGVGSDLDVVMIVASSDEPTYRRSLQWDFRAIPIPVEVLVYTLAEWQQFAANPTRMYTTLMQETVWLKKTSKY